MNYLLEMKEVLLQESIEHMRSNLLAEVKRKLESNLNF